MLLHLLIPFIALMRWHVIQQIRKGHQLRSKGRIESTGRVICLEQARCTQLVAVATAFELGAGHEIVNDVSLASDIGSNALDVHLLLAVFGKEKFERRGKG